MPHIASLPASRRTGSLILGALLLAAVPAACGGSGDDEQSVVVTADKPNVVSYWNAVANRTVVATGAVDSTEAEQRPTYHVDLATLHVAIYDAVSAIDGRFVPFAFAPTTPPSGASIEAAASAAAYGVLHALYPDRAEQYERDYEDRVAAIPDGAAKTRGLAVASEVAAAVVASRDRDGRAVALSPSVSSSAPGKFRSANATPFNRYVPYIKPFTMTRADQFRPAARPRSTAPRTPKRSTPARPPAAPRAAPALPRSSRRRASTPSRRTCSCRATSAGSRRAPPTSPRPPASWPSSPWPTPTPSPPASRRSTSTKRGGH